MDKLQIRKSELIIDLSAVKYNIKKIQERLQENANIMPVIKANAYGLGVKEVIKVIEDLNINIVAVAIVDEGIYLRDIGYNGEIFVLNQPYEEEIEKIKEYKLTVGVSAESFIEKLGESLKQIKVHIEIGTGMGRTGINPSRTKEFIEKIFKYKNIEIEGIYTHFSSSDIDYEYTKAQINSFNKAISLAKKLLKDIKYIHASNSAGIVNFEEAWYNLVRPGLIIYGYLPDENLIEKIDLKEACILKSIISYFKEVPENTSIGYGRSYITNRKTKIATIPIGYADGIKRSMSNKGNIVINNKLAPIIGKICMDSFMVDVTDIDDIKIGTDVYIWDNKNIKLEDVSKNCDTINYEILSTISDRVVRKYI